ncbi:MAG: hypothetical protein FJ308_01300 [Planctomycetes bacterium]|nr:hypothetical protein [Planctomycetota bacterium]
MHTQSRIVLLATTLALCGTPFQPGSVWAQSVATTPGNKSSHPDQEKTKTPYRLGIFSADATIPLNHRCMGILPQKSIRITDPLFVHGFAILGPEQPIVVVAVDWCEIRNASYDKWRDRLALAARTTRERVLVSSLHQHDAPVIDADAQELLNNVGLANELFDPEFHESVLDRVEEALRDAIAATTPITHVGYSESIVEDIASNRRIVNTEGIVSFSRGSSSGRELLYRDAEIGLIDPKLRTLSFWDNDRCLLEYHTYATHPMSYYGRGEVTSDFVGLARERRKRDDRNVAQVYASGCSGDVTAGKFNDGTPESRRKLTNRLYDAMRHSSDHVQRILMEQLSFKNEALNLEASRDENLSVDFLNGQLHDQSLSTEKRILAAMGLASWNRVARGQCIDMPCLDFQIARVVLFPGESFVGYQSIAQELSSGKPVLPIGYGECWTGYVPTESAFLDGFHENWLWVAPGAETQIRSALRALFE